MISHHSQVAQLLHHWFMPYGSASYDGANGYENGVDIYAVAGDPDIMVDEYAGANIV